MNVDQRVSRRELRAMWSDPARRARTLARFAAGAEISGREALAATRWIGDADLRREVERRAEVAFAHAKLLGVGVAADVGADVSADVSAHVCDELGEVAYVAMLHVASQRAGDNYEFLASLTTDDPQTRAVFEAIVQDERERVVSTGRELERWRQNGREIEVQKSLKRARSSRLLMNWRQLGLRSGAGFSRFMLVVMYWTALVPFGLLSRLRRRGPSPSRRTGLESQY